MGLPGHRRTSSHKRRRAAHFALAATLTTKCSHCGKPVPSHHVCPNCGYYRGKQIITIPVKTKKK